MSNLLLRKMTLKSIIGFGIYKDLSVQEIINRKNHFYLINIYYCLEKIDFNDEVKKILKIEGDRVINKPGKNSVMFFFNISQILDDLSIKYTKFKRKDKDINDITSDVKIIKRSNLINERKRISKMRNKNRNQK